MPPMPDFILANGRTLIFAVKGNNRIGMGESTALPFSPLPLAHCLPTGMNHVGSADHSDALTVGEIQGCCSLSTRCDR